MSYKPNLIEISVSDLVKHIRVKSLSAIGPSCDAAYTDEQACQDWADAGSVPDVGWVQMCMEVGPLLGCNEYPDWYCSTIITPIAR